ncbi:hypothetical protein LTR37_000089 [Vermiconidia calcicola]|uniref:Uncharacterized protein n=1 Tax=Vermiconidia calcicola TaxID=1690605 RepID=A0ACC3NZF6_9PEZI|nr:hypothetical protein LTR37_000089 [Vermiconidia calcicola]
MANKAAWVTEKQAYPMKVGDAPLPEPKENQITIRVRAVAINPVDYVMQAAGALLEKYPSITGCDAAGEVTSIGSAVGDRVAGCVDHDGDALGQGTFQLYCNLIETLAGKIPDAVSFTDACVLPIGMCTACTGLFEKSTLGLPLPQLQPKPNGKVLVVWGGSSSVGSCAIQAAKAAGFEVAATAGAHNLEYCKSIGADYAFDYKTDTLVEDVVAALKGKDSAGVFNAVMGEETYIKCAEIASQLGGTQIMSSVLPPNMPYDKPLPGGVKLAYNFCYELKGTEVGPAIWQQWVPAALANGTLKCKPDAYVVGQGLEKIQEAVDAWKSGASARKYVVEIP